MSRTDRLFARVTGLGQAETHCESRNRLQILDRIIERLALEQGLVDVRNRAAEKNGVSIGSGARDHSIRY